MRLSPNSVMETSLLGQAGGIAQTGAIFGSAGEGRVGMVALEDVARAGATVLLEGAPTGTDHQVTGPRAITLGDCAEALTQALGREISYVDMPDDDLRELLVEQAHMTTEEAEFGVLVHYRAWRAGAADLVTSTVRELTGRDPVDIVDWVAAHRAAFAAPAG